MLTCYGFLFYLDPACCVLRFGYALRFRMVCAPSRSSFTHPAPHFLFLRIRIPTVKIISARFPRPTFPAFAALFWALFRRAATVWYVLLDVYVLRTVPPRCLLVLLRFHVCGCVGLLQDTFAVALSFCPYAYVAVGYCSCG